MSAKKKIVPNDNEKGLVKKSDIQKEKAGKIIGRILSVILVIIVPIILVFLASNIQRTSSIDAYNWMIENPQIVFLNMTIIYIVFFALQMIIKKSSVSIFITSILYLLPNVISRLKYDVRGEVLLVNDFSLASNVGEMTSFIEITEATKNVLIISIVTLILITIIFALKFKKKNEISRRTSAVYFLLTLAFLVVTFSNQNILKFFNINNNIRYAPNIVHEKQGTILGLYSNFQMSKVEEPEGYSKEEIYKILNSVTKNQNVNNEKPDVIMIMSESFCDPLNFPNIEYSKDPLEYIRKLEKSGDIKLGNLITSTFAGGTSNVEYEAFTGTSSYFLPYGTVPYTDIPDNISNIDTIQKLFKNSGYSTIGLHSYIGTFYDRDKVYPKLGFDVFKEANDLKDVGYYGKYVGDVFVYKNIIEELENKNDNNPKFVWALTMQNHTPYTAKTYEDGGLYIDVSGDCLSEVAKDKLMGYVNGVYESSRRLEILIDYLKERKKPTILLFYGDHMPALYEVYYDTKMISTKDTTKWTEKEMYLMHQVPYFIYTNYENDGVQKVKKNLGAIYLGNTLLNLANIKKTSYFKFLDNLDYIALRDRLFVDEDNVAHEEITKEYDDIINRQKLLQYDMIYGENYVKKFDEENL